MNRTAKIVANVRVNGQHHTRNMQLDYNSYREESLRRWTEHINTLPEDERDQDPPEVTYAHFDEAVHRIAFQVSQEPVMITTGTGGREVSVVVGQPDYVEVIFGADTDLILPEKVLLS